MGADQLELLKVVYGRIDLINVYWNIYVAVALGTVGIMTTGKAYTKKPFVVALLSVAFIAFAAVNWDAISGTNEQRRALIELISGSARPVADKASPPLWWQLLAFHLAMDAIVIAGLWGLYFYGLKRSG